MRNFAQDDFVRLTLAVLRVATPGKCKLQPSHGKCPLLADGTVGAPSQVMNKNPYPESDPLHHTLNVKRMLEPVIEHLRKDVEAVTEPKAQALFETTAEVLTALVRTLDHYEQKTERAWQ